MIKYKFEDSYSSRDAVRCCSLWIQNDAVFLEEGTNSPMQLYVLQCKLIVPCSFDSLHSFWRHKGKYDAINFVIYATLWGLWCLRNEFVFQGVNGKALSGSWVWLFLWFVNCSSCVPMLKQLYYSNAYDSQIKGGASYLGLPGRNLLWDFRQVYISMVLFSFLESLLGL